ncbi:hypothetical protein SteCoe_17519 [Stentor coeruleus]|uniref:Uncharacterized protein n=1 Tax=Stentor coeruleus TaxID=5963 RepID=A0A1R2BYR0_9CILI|nr:hypothetical protein SteCoe_17519 [Stentor coeruleus]
MQKRIINNFSEPKTSKPRIQTERIPSYIKKSTSTCLLPLSGLPLIKDSSTPIGSNKFIKFVEEVKIYEKHQPNSKSQNLLTPISKDDDCKIRLKSPTFTSHTENKAKLITENQIKTINPTINNTLHINLEPSTFRKYSEDIQYSESETITPQSDKKNISVANIKTFEDESPKDTDTIENLKSQLQNMELKCSKLEILYQNDTNSLKKDIEKIRNENKRLMTENESLKSKVEKTNKACEEQMKLNQNKSLTYNKESLELQEILAEKNYEITQLGDLLKKNQIEKRDKEDIIRNLQTQIKSLQDDNKNQNDSYLNIQKVLKNINSEYDKEKMKFSKYQERFQKYKELRENYKVLEEKLKETTNCMNFVNGNLKDTQISFTQYKQKAEETEQLLKEQIAKLQISSQDSINFNWNREKAKLRKNLTLVGMPQMKNSDQNSSQINTKILSLENQLLESNQQIAKMARDIQYYKQIVEEKNKFIQYIENKTLVDLNPQVENREKSLDQFISCRN